MKGSVLEPSSSKQTTSASRKRGRSTPQSRREFAWRKKPGLRLRKRSVFNVKLKRQNAPELKRRPSPRRSALRPRRPRGSKERPPRRLRRSVLRLRRPKGLQERRPSALKRNALRPKKLSVLHVKQLNWLRRSDLRQRRPSVSD